MVRDAGGADGRVSAAQIDRGILNAAARPFAVHGYARTSVQQLADAVGYSKAGLLHRFGSKQALQAGAVAAAADAVGAVVPATQIGNTLRNTAFRAWPMISQAPR